MSKSSAQSWAVLTPERRVVLARRAQFLAGASVGYNTIEAVVAVLAGQVANSAALLGFGLDSTVEVASGLVILWQFRHPLPESREQAAGHLIAVAFFALAAFVTFEALSGLAAGVACAPNPPLSVSLWPVPRWQSCPSFQWPNAVPARNLGQAPFMPMAPKP